MHEHGEHGEEGDRHLAVQALFVGLALAGMLVGLAAEWWAGPSWLRWSGYAVAYLFGGWDGVREGARALRRLQVDIDLLMVLAALGALAIDAPFEGAMLLFLFSLSNWLQNVAIGRSRRAIRALMALRPESVEVRAEGGLRTVRVEEVAVGAVYVIGPGDRLPLDGEIIAGHSELDEASLTGESRPVAKQPGDRVFEGTINGSGALDVRVLRTAEDSTIARMIALVEEAQGEKAETQRMLDRFEQPYALGVIVLTVVAILVPWQLGEAFAAAFYRGITLMVAASPCALIISTPAAVLSAIAAGARHGVLFKGGVHVEQVGALRAVAFDKTGTLTEGKARLTELQPLAGDEDELLRLAASVQARSEHHLALATVAEARQRGLSLSEPLEFQASVGRGVTAQLDGEPVHVGNLRYFADRKLADRERAEQALQALEAQGRTAVLVARGEQQLAPLGVMGFADRPRASAAEVVAQLRALGIAEVIMLTGDARQVAEQIGAEVGIDTIHAEVLPERKVELVRELASRHRGVAMVGDGVNDAPALAAATVGVAMGGAGTDVALETADLVLMGDDLRQLPYALALGRQTRRTLVLNLSFALLAIAVMIGTILTVGLALPWAVVGHEGSTVLVCLNGLRLLAFEPRF